MVLFMKIRFSVGFDKDDYVDLEKERKRLGISIAELLRRIVSKWREK